MAPTVEAPTTSYSYPYTMSQAYRCFLELDPVSKSEYLNINWANKRQLEHTGDFRSVEELIATLEIPAHIHKLVCSGLQLNQIPDVRSQITHLDVSYNQFRTFKTPDHLIELDISNNPLVTLFLNTGLKYLLCNRTTLRALPPLPSTLEVLGSFSNPSLSDLPPLPPSLRYLSCSNCSITGLPELPETLETLACDYNSLSVLPSLPPNLKHLNAAHNRLLTLPPIPASCVKLEVAFNRLTELPDLPEAVKSLWILSNPVAQTFTSATLKYNAYYNYWTK